MTSNGVWVETGPPYHCLKYIGCVNGEPSSSQPRVWLWLRDKKFQFWKDHTWGQAQPWPEGMKLEEVKAYTETLWRFTR